MEMKRIFNIEMKRCFNMEMKRIFNMEMKRKGEKKDLTSIPAKVSCSTKPIFQLGFDQPVCHQVVQHDRHHLGDINISEQISNN